MLFEKICYFCNLRSPFDQEFCPEDGTPLAVTAAASLAGMTLGGRYQLLEEIGAGELGVVYKARHLRMDNTVAVKLLMSDPRRDEQNLQRFRQEAKAASMLNHPNIVHIFDFDEMPEGVPYLVMEYLEGQTAQSVLDNGGKMEPALALSICIQVCGALGHAHRRNVVHRDLKPTNVMIVREEDGEQDVRAILLDFGIAKVFTCAGKTLQKLTKSGQIFTSPLYMSPEQCMGQFSDARSDIYSMACLFHHLVAGSPPFQGNNYLQTVFMHVNETPDPLSARCPDLKKLPQLETAIAKALSKNPDHRQQSITELKRDLEQALSALNGGESTVSGTTGPDPGWKGSSTHAKSSASPGAGKGRDDFGPSGTTSDGTAADYSGLPPVEEEEEVSIDRRYGDEHFHDQRTDRDDFWDSWSSEGEGPVGDDVGLEDDEYDASFHKTIRDYLKRAKRGQASDMYDLAWHYRSGDLVDRSFKKAAYWFLKSAEGGDADAMYVVGHMYFYGKGVLKSYRKAFQWWLAAAEKGNPQAMTAVGDAYVFGWGEMPNAGEGTSWYRKAAEKGHAGAQKRLALCHEDGFGVQVDLEEAGYWWLKAAEKGDKHAQYRAGVCYRDGKGVALDLAEAVGWFECSAGQNYCLGRLALADCYERGAGAEKDPEEARRLVSLAALDGCPEARRMLTSGVTPPQTPGSLATSAKETAHSASQPPDSTASPGYEIWGDTKHGRCFRLRDDGSASYKVRWGETLEMIAKDLLRAIHEAEPHYQPDQEDLKAILHRIKSANEHVQQDFDLLFAGLWLSIPFELVRRIKCARKERLLVWQNGHVVRIYMPDGTIRKISRDSRGGVLRVEDTNILGESTLWKREGRRWLVMRPGDSRYQEYDGEPEID